MRELVRSGEGEASEEAAGDRCAEQLREDELRVPFDALMAWSAICVAAAVVSAVDGTAAAGCDSANRWSQRRPDRLRSAGGRRRGDVDPGGQAAGQLQ